MSEASIVAIILGILGILGGGGFWTYRSSKKDAPVRQRDAALVVADKSQQMALAVANDLREDYERLRGEISQERDARNQLTGRVNSLETHIREQEKTISHLRIAIQKFGAGWDDLVKRWEYHRAQESAPPRPTIDIEWEESWK